VEERFNSAMDAFKPAMPGSSVVAGDIFVFEIQDSSVVPER
jgi:hypothetical protein